MTSCEGITEHQFDTFILLMLNALKRVQITEWKNKIWNEIINLHQRKLAKIPFKDIDSNIYQQLEDSIFDNNDGNEKSCKRTVDFFMLKITCEGAWLVP